MTARGDDSAGDVGGGEWRQVPPARKDPTPVPVLVPWLVVMVPMYVQFGKLYDPSTTRRLLLAAAVGVVAAGLAIGPLAIVPALALGTAILVPEFGLESAVRVGLPAFGALLLISFATGAATIPRRLVDPRLLRPSLVLLVPAGFLLLRDPGLGRPTVFVAVAWLSTLLPLALPRHTLAVLDRIGNRTGPITDRIESVGAALGRVLAAVVMVPVGVLVTLLWACQRILRVDPLAVTTLRRANWAIRSGQDPRPQRLFSSAPFTGQPGAGYRIRSFASGALVVAVVAFPVTFAATRATGVPLPESIPIPILAECIGPTTFDAVMFDDPAWPGIACEFDDFSSDGRFDAVTTYTMNDYHGDHVDVTDGARRTWQAPECECDRISVWFLGGSGAFGWWQRDDFSPPSALAKAAWERGIALDITTYAMPGWVLGQESRRFGELLTTQDAPDVAIFYDGGNELNRQYDRNFNGRGADESATAFVEEDLNTLMSEGPFPWDQRRQPTDNIERGPKVGPVELADHAMNRYLRDVELPRNSWRRAQVWTRSSCGSRCWRAPPTR